MWLTLTGLLNALWQTLYMVVAGTSIALLVGLPLGAALYLTQEKGLCPLPWLHKMLGLLTNTFRSIPFIILLIAVIPLTTLLVGTFIGTTAAIVPLSVGAIPFMGRLIEAAFNEVSPALVETGIAMGATPFQIMRYILLPEALPSCIRAITNTFIVLVGYSAMAGTVGGGGLGDFAIRYGYERFHPSVMLVTVLILLALVQLIQLLGDKVARRFIHC